jgi:branched-chain amino acid transport system ATP-binding protein
MILEVKAIHTFYGPSHILFGVSLWMDVGEIVSLLGRNGAGKTTTLRTIMGLSPPTSGEIRFHGEDISGKPPYLLARKGLGYVPGERELFGELTVLENLQVATKKPNREHAPLWTLERIDRIFPILNERARQRANSLSGGEQQMLAIARTLMGNPEVLLLDEPTTGLSPVITQLLGQQILKLRADGLCILLAEQNVKFAIALGDRCHILDKGEIRFQGTVAELKQNEEVARMYLAV